MPAARTQPASSGRRFHTANAQQDENIVADLKKSNKKLRGEVKRLRQEHLVQLSTQTVPPVISVAFMAALNSYTRIRDHALNFAEVIAGEK